MSTLQEFGIELIASIQQALPGWDGAMNFVTFFGTINFYMIFVPLIFWTINKRLGLGALLVMVLTDFVGISFKLGLHQPRPYWISDKVQLLQSKGEPGYGIISTHASDPPVLLGYLALRSRKAWLWVLAIAFPLVISFSRLYLAVHFPHDILAGWLLAVVMLVLAVRYEEKILAIWNRWSTGMKVGLAFVLSMVMILVAVLISLAIAGSPDPASYAEYSSKARDLDIFVTLSGLVFGVVAGWTLMNQYACFSTGGSLLQKAARYVVGIAGMFLLLEGLGYLFDFVEAGKLVEYLLRYIRYSSVALWGIFGAPWAFLKLKLAVHE